MTRRRLMDRVARGVGSKLTLVSAPPGFGKSTLIGAWAAANRTRLAWVSLDVEDSEPSTFWTYVIAALQVAVPGLGAEALSALASPQAPLRLAVRSVINELMALDDEVVLVLDDYHVLEGTDVHDSVTLLLDHLPPRLHLIVVTRADPPLPLSRLRARGELTEIRAADLRFQADEAEAYLNQTMGLHLAGSDIGVLEARTEGWIAALQLAALSLQGRADAGPFIATFAGDDRYVVDYLVDEVLERQSDDVRSFLLMTSVLERLSASLCDAVTGREDGSSMLDALERANLFLVPLDDRRLWFRYHHLFGDVLRARLVALPQHDAQGLHGRASRWFAGHDEPAEAIHHAMAAGDPGHAADLMESTFPSLRRARQERSWLRWVGALPDEVLLVRPVLAVISAGILMSAGDVDRVDVLLDAAEGWLRMPPPERSSAGMVVVDDAEFARLPSAIALYRTAQARMRGDIPTTMAEARRALELAAADDHVGRGGAAAFLGLAYWATGDLDTAYRWYSEGMAGFERVAHLADVVAGAVTQADIRLGQGRLTDAMRVLERGLTLATSSSPALRGAPDMHVGIGDILRERDDLAGARQHLDAARAADAESAYRQYPYRRLVAMARLRQAEGVSAEALRLLDEAEAAYVGEFSPDVRPIAAWRARLWVVEGELARAWIWAHDHGLTAADTMSFAREFEHATLARLMLAQGRQDRSDAAIRGAVDLAAGLVEVAGAGRRDGSVLDALVVLALARHALGDVDGAFAALDRAVALAQPEAYVRVFLDEGRPMTDLLKVAARRPDASDYLRRLHALSLQARGTTAGAQPLVEPLSDRELEVLHLLDSELDGPAIARELVVSLSTVRSHTQTIYTKLGVNDRRAAVRRAVDLDLLPRTRG